MPDFIAGWLNTNDIFNAMTMMEYWDGMVTTVQLVFLSLVIGLVVAVPLAILRTVR
ncbi:MAG: amino acid ABC transporter permease, partial [Marinobacter sp.]|nr:amino acid ABC transporter permease [Marinobacter sp.]